MNSICGRMCDMDLSVVAPLIVSHVACAPLLEGSETLYASTIVSASVLAQTVLIKEVFQNCLPPQLLPNFSQIYFGTSQ